MKAEDIRGLLRDWIRERGTQAEIARKLGRPEATVSRWLNGKHVINLTTLDQMLTASGVDLLTLLSRYSDSTSSWQAVPLAPMRSVPPMDGDFGSFASTLAEAFPERISLPIREPALAMRLARDVLSYHANDVLGVVDAGHLEPGADVVVQLRGRTDVGRWQQFRGRGQVSIDDVIYDEDEFVMIGRVRGVWHDV